MSHDSLKPLIRDIPDFPKPGILFRDVTPLLRNPTALCHVVDALADIARRAFATVIAAPEARGFIFGAAAAARAGIGFVPIRKPGKLPGKTHSVRYALEYGNDELHMHVDGVRSGDRVLLVDDLLATGGTVSACGDLVRKAGAEITGFAFVIELAALNGRARLGAHPIHSLLVYP